MAVDAFEGVGREAVWVDADSQDPAHFSGDEFGAERAVTLLDCEGNYVDQRQGGVSSHSGKDEVLSVLEDVEREKMTFDTDGRFIGKGDLGVDDPVPHQRFRTAMTGSRIPRVELGERAAGKSGRVQLDVAADRDLDSEEFRSRRPTGPFGREAQPQSHRRNFGTGQPVRADFGRCAPSTGFPLVTLGAQTAVRWTGPHRRLRNSTTRMRSLATPSQGHIRVASAVQCCSCFSVSYRYSTSILPEVRYRATELL